VTGNILFYFYKKKRKQNKKNNKILPATSACCGAVVRNECMNHFSIYMAENLPKIITSWIYLYIFYIHFLDIVHNKFENESPRDSSIDWRPCFMKRRSLVRILPLPHVWICQKKKKEKVENDCTV
jgi:hypothetical protein